MASGPLTQGLHFMILWQDNGVLMNWFLNLTLQSHSLVMLVRQFTEHKRPCSILLSCTLNSGLGVSTESTRVLIWQPLAMFHRGIHHPRPTQIPPPTATKNSPGEKCYYEKGWLLCDSHCFIKKIFFSSKFSVEESKGFPKSRQNRTAHNTIC